MINKQLLIGSNGYFFINMIRVDEKEFRDEELRQQLNRIENKLNNN